MQHPLKHAPMELIDSSLEDAGNRASERKMRASWGRYADPHKTLPKIDGTMKHIQYGAAEMLSIKSAQECYDAEIALFRFLCGTI